MGHCLHRTLFSTDSAALPPAHTCGMRLLSSHCTCSTPLCHDCTVLNCTVLNYQLARESLYKGQSGEMVLSVRQPLPKFTKNAGLGYKKSTNMVFLVLRH